MSLPKILAVLSLSLFGIIGMIAIFKKGGSEKLERPHVQTPVEIVLEALEEPVAPASQKNEPQIAFKEDLPEDDRIEEFFNKNDKKFPIVETITYKSHVPWQKGRPAWLSDYASHFNTSRHFIARSLNGKPDYNKQEIAEGDKFNILKKDKNIEFLLVVDTSRCKMWFYYVDLDEKKKVLVKTYDVGLGRLDNLKESGLLTPLGKYTFGNRTAIFKPKVTGIHHGKKVEMMTVFGTRWIPFEKEIGYCTESAKGFGLHGTPWMNAANGQLIENNDSLGKYESDGCIRASTYDIEEIFSIVISRPTTIEIVRDFWESSPAKE